MPPKKKSLSAIDKVEEKRRKLIALQVSQAPPLPIHPRGPNPSSQQSGGHSNSSPSSPLLTTPSPPLTTPSPRPLTTPSPLPLTTPGDGRPPPPLTTPGDGRPPPIPRNTSSVTTQPAMEQYSRRSTRQQQLFPPQPPIDNQQQQSQTSRPTAPLISITTEPPQNAHPTADPLTSTTTTSALKIRCHNLTPEELADANRKNKRGIVVYKKTEDMFRKLGHRIPVEYSHTHQGPSNRQLHGQMSWDIGSCVRSKVPMLASSYLKLDVPDAGSIVYNTLSTWYELPLTSDGIFSWIEKQAQTRYRQWKSDCRRHFEKHGDAVPFEFLERPNEWQWLVNHFNTPEHKAKCAILKKTRTEPVRPKHHSGTVPFSYRSEVHELNGEPAPIIKTFGEVYRGDPVATPLFEKMNAKVNTILESIREERGETPNDEPMTLPVSTQLNVVYEMIPQTRGTSISGVGGSIRRSPKRRGGPRASIANEEILRQKDEIRELKESLAQHSNLLKLFEQKFKAMESAVSRTNEIGSNNDDSAPEVRQQQHDPTNPGTGNADENGEA